MKRIPVRRAFASAGVLVAALALTSSAFAHAELFPSTVPSGDGQLLMLTVPNEKENAATTEIQITIPEGFDLEHVAPVPGWTADRQRSAQAQNGERQGGNSITWKGKLSGCGARRAAVHGRAEEPRRVHLQRAPDLLGRQRRRVVRIRGLRHARGPHRGNRRHGSSSAARTTRPRHSASSPSSLGAVGARRRRRRARSRGGARHDPRRAGGRAARRLRACAGAAGCGVGARRAGIHATAGERRARPPAGAGQPHVQRAHRAALRGDLGHERAGHPGDREQPGQPAGRPEHDLRRDEAGHAGLVPRLVARDLGRRAPGARRVHVRGRAEPRPAAAVRDSVARRERGHHEPRHLPLGACCSPCWPPSGCSPSARLSRGRCW